MKISCLIFFLFGCLFTYGQRSPIQGSFKTQADYVGNTYVYFEGVNISDYDFSDLTISCVNEMKDEENSFSLDELDSGDSFSVGIDDGWLWEPGEKLYITFANGKSFYWTYVPENNFIDDPVTPYSIQQQPNQQNKVCYECHGTGRCIVCGGSGTYSLYGQTSRCSACSGTGICSRCKGTKHEN